MEAGTEEAEDFHVSAPAEPGRELDGGIDAVDEPPPGSPGHGDEDHRPRGEERPHRRGETLGRPQAAAVLQLVDEPPRLAEVAMGGPDDESRRQGSDDHEATLRGAADENRGD